MGSGVLVFVIGSFLWSGVYGWGVVGFLPVVVLVAENVVDVG